GSDQPPWLYNRLGAGSGDLVAAAALFGQDDTEVRLVFASQRAGRAPALLALRAGKTVSCLRSLHCTGAYAQSLLAGRSGLGRSGASGEEHLGSARKSQPSLGFKPISVCGGRRRHDVHRFRDLLGMGGSAAPATFRRKFSAGRRTRSHGGGQRMKSLYLCYFGLREPLVQTQVLPYLRQIGFGGVDTSRLTFDIRGFMPEEYVDAGLWPSGGALYRWTKAVERRLLAGADGFVVLTERARQILFPDSSDTDPRGRPIEVIPCCVDSERFED